MPAFSESMTGPEFRQFVELFVADQPPKPQQDSIGPGTVRGFKIPLQDQSGLELSIGFMEYDQAAVSPKSIGKPKHDKTPRTHFMALVDPNKRTSELEVVVDPLGRVAVINQVSAPARPKSGDPLPGALERLNKALSTTRISRVHKGMLRSLVEPLSTESGLV